MGKIEIVSKWDLEKSIWNKRLVLSNKGRSLAFGNYKIINQTNEIGVDYIILADGCRLENHSNDLENIAEKRAGVINIINFFEKTNRQVAVKIFLIDADAPIIEDAKFLAKYIDSLASLPNTNSINIIGLSKCGAMSFHLPKFFRNLSSFTKTNIFTIATPFDGTKMASPLILYPEIERLVKTKLGNNSLSGLVYKNIVSLYEKTSSNSHMDNDIAIMGSIPENKLPLYDPSFIDTIFSKVNISAISMINAYQNFVTGIDERTLKEAIKKCDITAIVLCILNECLMDKKSDGMVMTESQRLVEKQLFNFKSHIIPYSHHDVIKSEREINEVLHVVKDTLEEQKEKKIFVKRKKEL